ncbi:MAG: flagellar hook-length control protein FliK [Rhodospirillaceae bacterium]
MDIQSIYSGTKATPAAGGSSEEETGSASGFAALLNMVGTQFKATLGLGMDPVVIKTDAPAEPVRAPEPRDAKPRPERSDEKDAKATPAKDEAEGEEQTEETAASDETSPQAADAEASTQSGQPQTAQAAVAAVVDATLIAQTTITAPLVAAESTVKAAAETVVADVEVQATEVVAAEATAKTIETPVDVKAAVQTQAKTTENVSAPEAVVKDTARTQQATNAYAPAQATDAIDTVAVEAETVAAEAKTVTKDNAVRSEAVRSTAAQEQANSLARLLAAENRIQVQVQVNAGHAAKQTVADVSVYNIYAGYSAADAISLANGGFGQTDQSPAGAPAPRAEAAAPRAEAQMQTAVLAQSAPVPGTASTSQTNVPVRADALNASAVQAGATSSGASHANMNFNAFAQSGQAGTAQQTQQAAQPNPTERPAATAQQVIDQIKVNITKAAKAGLDRVTIQLKPADLGRIEIKLEMSEDHKVRVTVTADTKDTLSLLQTDSRALERTLNDAGLRTDANNLHFNLRSETDPRSADGQNGHGTRGNGAHGGGEAAAEAQDPVYDYAAAAYARGGVDTFA